MLDFLITWAEEIIIALIIVVLIEMILPNSSYKKYIKMILGLFIIYTILSPILSEKFENIEVQNIIGDLDVKANVYNETSVATYNNQIEETYKEKFEETLEEDLNEKGYTITSMDLDINYDNEELTTNKLELIISKASNGVETIEKVEISSNEEVKNEELEELKTEISENYGIDISKISIESEKNV